MRTAKLIVLLAGVLGVLAFFLPLATFTHDGKELGVSAYEVFTGVGELEDRVDGTTAEVGKTQDDVYRTLPEIKTVVLICFLPGALLALIGLVAVARGRFGRLGGTICVLLGAVALLVFTGLNRGAEASGGDATRGAGMYLVLATGLLGVIGGLAATVSPDHGRAAT